MQQKLSSLSVFFPVFNEEENIELFIKESLDFLPKVATKFEVIIVNDGSSDKTQKISKNLVKNHKKIRLISHRKNQGYGAALRTGFREAKHDWVFFTDGDLQFELKQLKKFIAHTKKYDAIIGFRENRAEGGIRVFNAWLFKLYVDILFRLGVRDIDCAFKLFRTKTFRSIKLRSTGAFISAEFLYKLKKKGVDFKQLPVTHFLRRFGNPTGNNPKVIVKAGFEALQLYLQMKKESFLISQKVS